MNCIEKALVYNANHKQKMRQIKWYKWSVHGTELAINITISLASVAE